MWKDVSLCIACVCIIGTFVCAPFLCIEYLNGCLCPPWLTQGHLSSSTEAAATVFWLGPPAIRPVFPYSATRWRCGCVANPSEAISLVFKFFSPLIYSETYWACLHLAVYRVSLHPLARVWLKETWLKKKNNNQKTFYCSRGRVTVFQTDILIICVHLLRQTWLQLLLCVFCFGEYEHLQCSTQTPRSVLPFSNSKSLSLTDWKTAPVQRRIYFVKE